MDRFRTFGSAFLLLTLLRTINASAQPSVADELAALIDPILAAHPGKSGAYILEKGEESLLARAWLGDHAARTIDIQYFIWSTDNIGILANEALVRAADRGVKVRVLLDDFGTWAVPRDILQVAAHPLIDIRIYNPKTRVGVSRWQKYRNALRDFWELNQRMHDKTFIVDQLVAITGGRNMADEYYDYDHEYTFRDRDVLLLGPVAKEIAEHFDVFWNDARAVPVAEQLRDQQALLTADEIERGFAALHSYAANAANFAPEVRQALEGMPRSFPALLNELVWDEVRLVRDRPGKNDGDWQGGGESTRQLIDVLEKARQRIVIQSPYLVMPEGGLDFFKRLTERGVTVSVVTNSMASTDNHYAFSGYHKRRKEILDAGIEVFEYRPHPRAQQALYKRTGGTVKTPPIFAIHAKSFVVDGETLFVGTFNLDPRSANLNTEIGVLIRNSALVGRVERAIQTDMSPENSWNARTDDPDQYASRWKRFRIWLYEWLPLDSVL